MHFMGQFVAILLQGRSQIEVQQVSDRSSMAAMNISAEQQRLMDFTAQHMQIGEVQPGKKSEYAKFCEFEPMRSLRFLLSKVNGSSVKKDEEIEQICGQVSTPEEMVGCLEEKFKDLPMVMQQLKGIT